MPIWPPTAFILKEQWSVETIWSELFARPCHSGSWFSLGRSGGDMTNFAPSKPGRS
ncbi:MAG: hypothetical protein NTX64_06720 [Elusimicrobia bacterium]|nr:hypothetical protein [Elusimicrobiota bacterium]